MSGGIEDTIFANIESGSGETFDSGDSYDPSQTEPTNKGGERNQQDHELDNAERQLRSRERPSLEDDQLQRPTREAPKGRDGRTKEGADQQKQTDEFGNPVGSNSFHVTRRLKSQLDNQRQVATGLKTQVEHLTRQLAEVQVLGDLPKRLGMNNEELADFVQIAGLIKGNPVEGARKAIEVALARGANLKDIVNDEFIPNISLNATRALLDKRLGPAKEPAAEPNVDVVKQEAEEQARQFLADYPDAQLHGDVIADQMRKIEDEYASRGVKVNKYVVAEKAYNRLEEFCVKNQLDITKPLAPQLEARERAPSGDRRNTPNRQSPRPIPSGSNGGGELSSRKSKVADTDDSYSSIIRESMLEQGYNFN